MAAVLFFVETDKKPSLLYNSEIYKQKAPVAKMAQKLTNGLINIFPTLFAPFHHSARCRGDLRDP